MTMTRIFNRTREKAKRRFLRKAMPEPEVILWSKLKGKQIGGFKFRRQYSVGSYIIDFYCPTKRLAIELDGEGHFVGNKFASDQERQQWIERFNIRFLRFTNDEIRANLDGVIDRIGEALQEMN
jgi:very-short-patch-repair endonuclease